MNLKVWDGIWEQGELKSFDLNKAPLYLSELAPGFAPKCIVVPEGWRIRFGAGKDGSGTKSVWFQAGEYYDLSFYPGAEPSECAVFAEDVGVHADQLMTLYQSADPWSLVGSSGEFGAYWNIAPGAKVDFDDFWPGHVKTVKVPQHSVGHFWPEDGAKGEMVELQPGVHHLSDYGGINGVRVCEVVPDDFVLVGIEFDWAHAVSKPGKVSVAELTAQNNTPSLGPDDRPEVTRELSGSVECTQEEDWNASVSIDTTASVTAKEEFAGSGVDETLGVSVDVSAGYGQSTSKTTTVEQSESASYPLLGFVDTSLAKKAAAGSTVISVADVSSLRPDDWVTVGQGLGTAEQAKIAAISTPTAGDDFGASLTLRDPLLHGHADGEHVFRPGESVQMTLECETMAVDVDVVRTWQSQRTGEKVDEHGKVHAEQASEATVSYQPVSGGPS